ncbi:YqaJ viral recombinase family protein [Arthrobacter sulfonylureivorans]|uniref:YqaJ viral recombinase family nuclease n=1 Tax=Arthrobacter sulfonylureivorans TaxID=2486855 RepID=UPI0039E502C1
MTEQQLEATGALATAALPEAPEEAAAAVVYKANYACPDATLVLRADAPHEDWLQMRREGIGGSDVSSIVGLNPWGSAYETWLDKIGERPDIRVNNAMRWGKLLEPALRQAFMEDTGLKVRSAGLMRSKEHPFMQVSVDGLVEDGGIFESKTSTGWLSEDWEDGQVPDHAELQVLHGLGVTGRSHGHVVGLLDGRDWIIRRVERDQKVIDQLIEIEREFWTVNVLRRIEPALTANALGALKTQFNDVVATSKTHQPLELVLKLRDRIEDAKAKIKHWEEAKDTAEAEVRLLFGNHELMINEDDGETELANLKQNGTFAAKRFKEENPELAEQYTKPTPALDTKALAEDHPETYAKYRARVLRFKKIQTPKEGSK